MIRINLLEQSEGGAPREGGRSLNLSVGGPFVFGSVLLVALTVLWLGWATWSKNARLAELETDIDAANKELQALQKALEKVDEFQAKKNALEQRVTLISDLKRRQVVPVHLLDQVSRELPDYLWLDDMREQAGAVRLAGKATSYNAVSNFYNNLKGSPFFDDVTLGTTKRVNEGVSFQLSCRFEAPRPGSPGAANTRAPLSEAKGG
jgi:type IV pilus assembly protein PilN